MFPEFYQREPPIPQASFFLPTPTASLETRNIVLEGYLLFHRGRFYPKANGLITDYTWAGQRLSEYGEQAGGPRGPRRSAEARVLEAGAERRPFYSLPLFRLCLEVGGFSHQRHCKEPLASVASRTDSQRLQANICAMVTMASVVLPRGRHHETERRLVLFVIADGIGIGLQVAWLVYLLVSGDLSRCTSQSEGKHLKPRIWRTHG